MQRIKCRDYSCSVCDVHYTLYCKQCIKCTRQCKLNNVYYSCLHCRPYKKKWSWYATYSNQFSRLLLFYSIQCIYFIVCHVLLPNVYYLCRQGKLGLVCHLLKPISPPTLPSSWKEKFQLQVAYIIFIARNTICLKFGGIRGANLEI